MAKPYAFDDIRERRKRKLSLALTPADVRSCHRRLCEHMKSTERDSATLRDGGTLDPKRDNKRGRKKSVTHSARAGGSEIIEQPVKKDVTVERRKGLRHKSRALMADAAIIAAERVGMEYGRHGLVSYLMKMARDYPKEYLRFLGRLIPLHAKIETDKTVEFVDKIEIVGLESTRPEMQESSVFNIEDVQPGTFGRVLTVNNESGEVEEVADDQLESVVQNGEVIVPMNNLLRYRAPS